MKEKYPYIVLRKLVGYYKKRRKSTVFVDIFAIKYKQQQIFYDHFHNHENAVPDEKYIFF